MSNIKEYYCAIDLGATSGRVIIAADNGSDMEEVHRFANNIMQKDGRYFWDINTLIGEIKEGLKKLAARNDIRILSIGVDTWGVDVVFLGEDGSPLAPPRSYRDPYTTGMVEEFSKLISTKEVYERTGIQFMNFNTLFQLFACSREEYTPFIEAKHYLFIPDYINYVLSGRMTCEYTILSTSQLLNPYTKEIDKKLVEAAGAKSECFAEIVMPGTLLGNLKKDIAEFDYDIPIIAVAGHDTASAVAAVPANKDENFAYLSSGTWSLMGIVSKEPIISERSRELNFTNEGGIDGTTRVLKNCTGMWILEQCRKEWTTMGKEYGYDDIMKMCKESGVATIFNTDDDVFANPDSMLDTIKNYCESHNLIAPKTDADIVKSIFHSLANRYGEVFIQLQELSPFNIERLYIIGGGARNTLLNNLTEEVLGIKVIAGPTEATALGNVKVQMESIRRKNKTN